MVGGSVRDKLLDIPCNDIDYMVITQRDVDINDAFENLSNYLLSNNHIIYQKIPECLAIKAKNKDTNQIIDYVFARKDVVYDNNSRKPIVKLGTLEDDLKRRDFTLSLNGQVKLGALIPGFTINALAISKDDTNEIIDVCNGLSDLDNKILRTITDPKISLLDDPLRIIRGLRFSIVLDFNLTNDFF